MKTNGKQVRFSLVFFFNEISMKKLRFPRGTPHYDRTFFELLRRRMEHDRQRAKTSPTPNSFVNPYLGPVSLITFLVALGVLFYTLRGRLVRFDEGQYVRDPRSRNYQAYREWQRLSSLKDADSIPMRERTKNENDEK